MKSPSSLLYFKYFRYNVSPPPVQRGIDHETEARQDYLTTIKPYTKTQKYIYQEIHCSKNTHLLELQVMAELLKMKTQVN